MKGRVTGRGKSGEGGRRLEMGREHMWRKSEKSPMVSVPRTSERGKCIM